MSQFINKQTERFAYLWLLLSLATGWCVIKFLIFLALIFRKRKPTKDFLFFPYSYKNNPGTVTRFQDYFSLLDKDNFTYDVHYPNTESQYNYIYHERKSKAVEYFYYHNLFWKRLGEILKSPNYKAVFFQRTLYPEYYSQRHAILEQLLRAYHNNIIVDFFDSDHARNEKFYLNVIKNCDKVTVVNQYLYDYYRKYHAKVYVNDLSIDASRYITKVDYHLHQPVRFFWTGMIENAQFNLPMILPVLEKLNKETPLKLIVECNSDEGLDHPLIEFHKYNSQNHYDLLADSDIALYPVATDDEFNRGKVAYKTLEYACAKIPIIASQQGLSSRLKNSEDVLIANDLVEWEKNIHLLMRDENLRKRLADSAFEKILEYHDVHATYKNFLHFLQA